MRGRLQAIGIIRFPGSSFRLLARCNIPHVAKNVAFGCKALHGWGERIILRQIGVGVATGQHPAQTYLCISLPGGLERDHVQ